MLSVEWRNHSLIVMRLILRGMQSIYTQACRRLRSVKIKIDFTLLYIFSGASVLSQSIQHSAATHHHPSIVSGSYRLFSCTFSKLAASAENTLPQSTVIRGGLKRRSCEPTETETHALLSPRAFGPRHCPGESCGTSYKCSAPKSFRAKVSLDESIIWRLEERK
jgi:hypothetical protein